MIVPNYYIGQTFNRLTLKAYVGKKKGMHYYECLCTCGQTKIVNWNALKPGGTQSCGCLQNERAADFLNQFLVEGTNLCNLKRGLQSNNSTGVKGVYYDQSKKKFRAYIGLHKKQIKLGYFETLEEAAQARLEAEQLYHQPILEKYSK